MSGSAIDYSKRLFSFYRAEAINSNKIALIAGLISNEGYREEINPFYYFDIASGWELSNAYGDSFVSITHQLEVGTWATSRKGVSVGFERGNDPIVNFSNGTVPIVLNDLKFIDGEYFACGAGGLFSSSKKLGAMKPRFDRIGQVPDISNGSLRDKCPD